jgi:hypothetical protein
VYPRICLADIGANRFERDKMFTSAFMQDEEARRQMAGKFFVRALDTQESQYVGDSIDAFDGNDGGSTRNLPPSLPGTQQ